jgi:hypothetical protein
LTEKQTVAGAYAMISEHEKVCAERWKGVDFKLNLVFGAIGAAIMLAMAVGGWGLSTLMANQQQQLQILAQQQVRGATSTR